MKAKANGRGRDRFDLSRHAKANARTLLLSGQGVEMDAIGGHFEIRQDGGRPLKLPVSGVRQIVVERNAGLRSRAMRLALRCGIPVSFFGRCGELLGHSSPPLPPRIDERIAQYGVYGDGRRRLGLARRIVQSKIESCLSVLESGLASAECSLRQAVRRLQQSHRDAGLARTLESLRGIEGSGARTYFDVLAGRLHGNQPFAGRNRRPPRDPVNSLLSYGYCVLVRDLAGKLESIGLDPYVGYLHEAGYGSPALALDLAEPLRAPVIDRIVIGLLEELDDEAFSFSGDGDVILQDQAKKLFFERYEGIVRIRDATQTAHPGGSLLLDVAEAFSAALTKGFACWKPVPMSCLHHLS